MPPPPLEGAVRLGKPHGGGFAIARPICAAAFDFGAAFGAGGIAAESDSRDTLQAIAATAKANKIFDDHCAAVCFRDDVAAFIGVPCAASGAAIKAGEHCVADRGGDAGFLGHWLSFLAIHRPYGTPRGNASENFTFFHFFFRSRFVHVLFRSITNCYKGFSFCAAAPIYKTWEGKNAKPDTQEATMATTLALTLESVRVGHDRVALIKRKRLDGVIVGYEVVRNGVEKTETLFRGISEMSARHWFRHFSQ